MLYAPRAPRSTGERKTHMAATIPPGTAVLWLGNDFRAPDPNTSNPPKDVLFHTSSPTADAFSSTGGLGYDATTDTLWVGAQRTFLRHVTLDGRGLAIVTHGQKN